MKRPLAAVLALSLAVPAFAQKPAPPVLRAGYRAVSIPLPAHQLALVNPGDRVDVMVTFEAILAKGEKEKVTATLLQNVVLLTVDRKANLAELELNPNEAQYAALSVTQGDGLWLARRAAGDVDMKPMEMASFRKLFR